MKKVYLLAFGLSLTIIAHAQLPASANLKAWYDADINIIVNGSGEVTDWDDNSGNGNDAATVLTGATLETVTGNDANNYSFVRFSGNSFLSSSYGGTTTGNLTIFIVLNNATNASSAVSFRNGNDSIVYPSANYRDKYGVQLSVYPHSENKSIGSGVTGKGFEVVAFRYERNTQVSGISTWRNGMMLSGKTSPDTALPALFLHIGGYENATQSTLATADIAQVIVYDAALDETDMQAAFSYLSTRYNIPQNQHAFSTIAAGDWNDPLIWAGGTVPGANDDVIIAPTGPFEWVDLYDGTASCKNLIVLENAGLRLTTALSSPTLNIGVGNGYNNEFAVKGSFYLDSAQLNIHGNWYVSCTKSDTLSEGFQLGGSATIIIDGNNGVAAQSVSSDKALVDILNFGDAFGLSSTRLSSNVTGKIFITIVDPHFSANGITINNFSSSYVVSPSYLAAHSGALRLGNGISTQSSSNPKGFVLGTLNNFFSMKVIANSNAANNRHLTFEGFVTCDAGLTINSGAVVNSSAGLQISWDLDNNGTLNQNNTGSLYFSTNSYMEDSLAVKGTGIFNISNISAPVEIGFTGRSSDTTIKKFGIYAPLTIDYGQFVAPALRVYLHQPLTITHNWKKTSYEDQTWEVPYPSYIICKGTAKLIQKVSPLPVDSLRFYTGLDDAFAAVTIVNSGTPDQFSVSVRPGVTNGSNKPNLFDFEWVIDESIPGGTNADLVFQWRKSKELLVADSTTFRAKHFNSSATNWEDLTTQTDQNSFYTNHRKATAKTVTVFSPFSIGTLSGALPVELLDFTARKEEQTSILDWKTAQEENSDRFEIERATSNSRFRSIGTVAAAGNTSSVTAYTFTDLHPEDGVNYYRLKQIDIDGHFEYSNIIPVNFGSPDKLLVSPNPATDRLNIRLPKNKRYTNLQIIDASGKVVMQQPIGASTINLSPDIRHLPRGWYLLNITGDPSQQQAFLKQ